MVWAPAGRENWIVSFAVLTVALAIASRSEPAPESFVLVTVKVAALVACGAQSRNIAAAAGSTQWSVFMGVSGNTGIIGAAWSLSRQTFGDQLIRDLRKIK